MDSHRETVVQEWITKAERDFASAVRLLEGEPPFLDTAVYDLAPTLQRGSKSRRSSVA
jgi:hypothetical protein